MVLAENTTSSSGIQKNPQEVAYHGPALLSKKPNKQVQFGKAHFYQHSIIVGDNPACADGFPLTIDWKCTNVVVVNAVPSNKDSQVTPQQPPHDSNQANQANQVSFVTTYETSQQSSHSQSRVPGSSSSKTNNGGNNSSGTDVMENSISRFRLSSQEREHILRSMGYQRQELIRLCKPVNIVRAQRRKTVETLQLEPFQNVLQCTRKCLFSKLFMSSQQRQERQRLKQWRKPTSTTRKTLNLLGDATSTAATTKSCISSKIPLHCGEKEEDSLTETNSNSSFHLLALEDPVPRTEQ